MNLNSGGQRGIRTLEPRLEAAPLAGVWFRPTHPSVQARNEITQDSSTIEYKNYKMLVNIRNFINDSTFVLKGYFFGKDGREDATFKIGGSRWYYKNNATHTCVKNKYDWDSDSLFIIAYDDDSLKEYRGIFEGKLTLEGDSIKYSGVYINKKGYKTKFIFSGQR